MRILLILLFLFMIGCEKQNVSQPQNNICTCTECKCNEPVCENGICLVVKCESKDCKCKKD